MHLYTDYTSNSGNVGQQGEGPVATVNGVQTLTPIANGVVGGWLSQLVAVPAAAPTTEAIFFTAVPCAKAQEMGVPCTAVLDVLATRPPGSTVLVAFSEAFANASEVPVTVALTPAAAAALAGPGSALAVFNPEGATKEEKKSKTPLLIGAVAGGALGFAGAGPPGAVAGAAAGAFLGDWLA
jgi:hypothetical protein